jgi:putative YphP/YqiW family bacilliredoxin
MAIECRMPYPEMFVAPMREELTRLGVVELRTPDAVDRAVTATPGTLMVIVNSVCGCAAGKARPGVALALRHGLRPDTTASVFAGFDIEATARARRYFNPYPPSSPSIALLKDGKLVYMMERRDIENRDASQIAGQLTAAFERFCGEAGANAGETAASPPAPNTTPPSPDLLQLRSR